MRSRASVHPAVLLGALLLTAVVMAACSGGSGSPATDAPPATAQAPAATPASQAPAAPAGDGTVEIKGSAFAPASLTVTAGTTVTWTNLDSVGHTVTATDGSFASETLAEGATFSQAFPTAGTFAYACKIHPGMKGTVIVQ